MTPACDRTTETAENDSEDCEPQHLGGGCRTTTEAGDDQDEGGDHETGDGPVKAVSHDRHSAGGISACGQSDQDRHGQSCERCVVEAEHGEDRPEEEGQHRGDERADSEPCEDGDDPE